MPWTPNEPIRQALTAQQWAVTKGHIEASVALRGVRRITDTPDTSEDDKRRHNEWLRFRKAADEFIHLVENEGWSE